MRKTLQFDINGVVDESNNEFQVFPELEASARLLWGYLEQNGRSLDG